MLYDAVCHENLQSVIRYPYPICIRGIVENDIRIYLYPQKFTDIRKYLSAVPYPRTSGHQCTENNKCDVIRTMNLTSRQSDMKPNYHNRMQENYWVSVLGTLFLYVCAIKLWTEPSFVQ